MTTLLNPIYDARKSFYGKASVTTTETGSYLTSYSTKVAEIEDGKLKVFGTYSPTTLRHIKEYMYQNGFEVVSKKEIEALYM